MDDSLFSGQNTPGSAGSLADPPVSAASGPLADRVVAAATSPSLPEDLRAPWDFVDMVIFIVFSMGMLVLSTEVAATIAVSYMGVPQDKIMEFATTNAGFIVLRQIGWFALLLSYLYLMVRMRTAEPVWRTLGWRGLPARRAEDGGSETMAPAIVRKLFQIATLLVSGAALAIAIQIATRFVGTNAKLPIQALLTDRRSLFYMMGFGLLVAPLVEETVFRGFLYPVMARRFGVVMGVVLTGTLFGLMHAEQLWGGWGEISLLILVGIVFTSARAWSGSVAVSYLLHFGYNGLLFLGTYIATDGFRHLG